MAVKLDQFPYKKLLLAGAFLQLVLGFLLYMTKAVVSTFPLALCGISLFCIVLAAKWHHKASRVIVRTLTWGISIAALLLSLAMTIFSDYSNLLPSWGEMALFFMVLLLQTGLLTMIPAMTILAHMQQKRMDIFVLRLCTIIEFLLSIATVSLVATDSYLEVGIDNIYYCLFFVAICVLTALCALAAFQIKSAWLNKLLNQPISRKDRTSENED